jgi:phospholipase C
MAGEGTDNALDNVVVVMSGNRSLDDSVLGRLYGPGDGKTFEGVTGKDLTNPIPEWAGHGADRKKVLYTVAADMNSPNPGTGEEYPHIIHNFLAIQFPLLHPAAPGPVPRSDPDVRQL